MTIISVVGGTLVGIDSTAGLVFRDQPRFLTLALSLGNPGSMVVAFSLGKPKLQWGLLCEDRGKKAAISCKNSLKPVAE